jgi:aspartate aminotransferase-like enzyme
MDGWGIDVIIGGSQKAVMIPPGLAYCAVSDRAWQRMESSKNPRYYFDLRKERKNAAKGESSFTPAIALIAALGAALKYLADSAGGDMAAGRDALIANAQLAADMTRAAAQAMGLKLFAQAPHSAALTAIVAPAGLDSSVIVKAFRERFGAVIANGQGDMKGKMFRIAHIGYYDYLDTIGIIAGLEQIMASVAPGKTSFGKAVAAAQEVYANATAPVAVTA